MIKLALQSQYLIQLNDSQINFLAKQLLPLSKSNLYQTQMEQNIKLHQFNISKTDQSLPLTSVSAHFIGYYQKKKLKNKQKKIIKKQLKISKSKQDKVKEKSSQQQNQVNQRLLLVEVGEQQVCEADHQLLQKEDEPKVNEEIENNNYESQEMKQDKRLESIIAGDQKQSINYYSWSQDIIIYHKQFTHLYDHLNNIIKTKLLLNQQKHPSNECSNHSIIIFGDNKSGKKHLINQVLDKLHKDYNNTSNNHNHNDRIVNQWFDIQLIFEKQFINQRTSEYVDDVEGNQEEEVYGNDFHQKDLGKKIVLKSVICSEISGTNFLNKLKLLNNSKQTHSILLVFHCLTYQQSFSQQYQQLINNFTIIKLPSIISKHKPNQTITNPLTTINELILNLEQFLAHQITRIKQQINYQLNESESDNSSGKATFKIDYTESVKKFAVKFLVKRYENNENEAIHPIVGIKYFENYFKNYCRKEIARAQRDKKHDSDEDNSICLTITSNTINNFFNLILSSPSSSSPHPTTPITSLSLTSLILGHQLILISCHMYLTHPHYLHSLYINALKLYPFFVMTAQSINIQPYEQKCYWSFLQKLKERGLIKFLEDRESKSIKKRRDNNSRDNHDRCYKRKGKKIKRIEEYQNKNFILLISIDKIKDDLSQLQIYHKFFYQSF